jgi:hypothetical protein
MTSYPINAPQHRLQEYIPTYVPHSDFIPTNQVVDSRQTEAQQVVFPSLSSSANMRSRNREEEFSLKDQLSSTPEDTSPSEPMKTWMLEHPSPKPRSSASSRDEWYQYPFENHQFSPFQQAYHLFT